MSYQEFVKPYPDGYVDGESGDTPVTAAILNTNYDGFLLALNEFLPELKVVEANPSESATAGNLTKLKVGSGIYSIPSGGSGGASDLSDLGDVTITNVQDGQILKWNSTTSKWENVNDTGGGSGHTILDDDGTALAQEDDLQFVGVYSEDDPTDEATKVNIYREMTKAEFNLLSSVEKKGFIRTTDEPDIYSDGHFQPIIYSTEEREIGVWTDGKPLYEKTMHTGALSTGENNIAHNVSNIEHLISASGKFIYSTYENVFPFVSIGSSTWNVSFAGFNSTNIIIEVGSEYAHYPITDSYTTIRYTKTTDTAGSGSWTPQGVPTHKYSTEEHIIGTWIDGKTLYEKSISGVSITSGTEWIDLNVDSSVNIKSISGVLYQNNGFSTTLPSADSSAQIGLNVISDTIITDKWAVLFRTSNTDARGTADITIQYTKSS